MNGVRRVLFVCSGNICRSPLAEELLRVKLRELGKADEFQIDSAGTVADHLGQQADERMRRTAARRGVRIDHRARRVTNRDAERFDLIVGMDDWHMSTLSGLVNGTPAQIRKLREFDPEAGRPAPDVPDPWYGGMDGFERVYEMVDRACTVLARELTEDA